MWDALGGVDLQSKLTIYLLIPTYLTPITWLYDLILTYLPIYLIYLYLPIYLSIYSYQSVLSFLTYPDLSIHTYRTYLFNYQCSYLPKESTLFTCMYIYLQTLGTKRRGKEFRISENRQPPLLLLIGGSLCRCPPYSSSATLSRKSLIFAWSNGSEGPLLVFIPLGYYSARGLVYRFAFRGF